MLSNTTLDVARLLNEYLASLPAPAVAARSARASEAGMCARAVWYRAHGVARSERRSLRSQLAMRIGTHLRQDLANALSGPARVAEASWAIDGLSGHADMFIRPPDGPDTIVEFKTVNPFSWGYYDRPKGEHSLQLQLNAYGLLETGQAEGIPRLWLIYLIPPPSDDDALELYEPQYSMELARNEHVRLMAAARSKILVPAEYSPHDDEWQCRYCSWLSRCEDEAEGDDGQLSES